MSVQTAWSLEIRIRSGYDKSMSCRPIHSNYRTSVETNLNQDFGLILLMSLPSLLLLLDTIMCIPLSLFIDVRHLARDILLRSASSTSPYLLLVLAFILPVTWILVKDTNIPLANKPKWFQTRIDKQFEFLSNGQDTFQHCKSAYPGRRFRLLTDKGELVVLPQSYAVMIRNESSLDFGVSVSKDFHSHLPSFQPFRFAHTRSRVLQTIVSKMHSSLT
ncbi:hypothetical protein LY78DRAFT_323511 [Colletotrichum sublineola]|nr:hypothetical protein LY78DRAFT_323511 [Colletotrichum sublineola]